MGFLAQLGFAGIVNLFVSLWPVITAGIQIAERAMPAAGSGQAKFDHVLQSVSGVALALPQVTTAIQNAGHALDSAAHQGDVASLTSSIGECINVAVKLANTVGAFQKSGLVQAAAPKQEI